MQLSFPTSLVSGEGNAWRPDTLKVLGKGGDYQGTFDCSFHVKVKDDRSALSAGRGVPLRKIMSPDPAHKEGRKETSPALGPSS